MKNIMLLLLAVLLFPCVILGADKPETTPYKTSFIVKNDDEAKFKVVLPAGWTAKIGADQKLTILGEKKDKDGKNVKKAMILFGFDVNKTGTELPPEYLEKVKKSYKALMDDKQAKEGVKQAEDAIGKHKGTKLEYQLKIGKSVSMFWQYLSMVNKEDVMIVTCTAPTAVFKEFEEDFKAIMASIEIEIAQVGK